MGLAMRQGVSGFQGARLTQAREGRGMTQSMLATLIGRSSTAVSRWEKGEQLPESDALESLERQLAIPSAWFLKSMPEYGKTPYFFRSKVVITRSARNIARTRLEFTQEISQTLQEWVEWPSVNVPSFAATDYLKFSDKDIESIALDVRKHWKLGLGPISDMILVLENAGIVISREEIGYSNMDGVSKWFAPDERPYIFLATDKRNSVRQRFDAAHELAHLVLHRYLGDIEFNARYAEIERQANLFAGIFLLPDESFSAEISMPSLDTFVALKTRWKTSVGAMISRAKQLDIITEDYATRLWKNYSARGWRRGEPGDDQTPFEESRLMRRAVNLLIDEGGFDRARIVAEIGLFEQDIERLCGLPEGFFCTPKKNIVQIKLRDSNQVQHDIIWSSGNVVDIATRRNT
jgi:Zn-dependent peptidase ImmA (M78 family)/DNA-binding XRE family transcriptional regulator